MPTFQRHFRTALGMMAQGEPISPGVYLENGNNKYTELPVPAPRVKELGHLFYIYCKKKT
jgi:hypothetical protein